MKLSKIQEIKIHSDTNSKIKLISMKVQAQDKISKFVENSINIGKF